MTNEEAFKKAVEVCGEEAYICYEHVFYNSHPTGKIECRVNDFQYVKQDGKSELCIVRRGVGKNWEEAFKNLKNYKES